MKYYIAIAIFLLHGNVSVFGSPSFCRKCHSEVEEDCFVVSKNTPNETCNNRDNVSCFEINYYDTALKKTFVERGCWPTWIQPNEDPNVCHTSKDKLTAIGGIMLSCSQCTYDYCNSKSFAKLGVAILK